MTINMVTPDPVSGDIAIWRGAFQLCRFAVVMNDSPADLTGVTAGISITGGLNGPWRTTTDDLGALRYLDRAAGIIEFQMSPSLSRSFKAGSVCEYRLFLVLAGGETPVKVGLLKIKDFANAN